MYYDVRLINWKVRIVRKTVQNIGIIFNNMLINLYEIFYIILLTFFMY